MKDVIKELEKIEDSKKSWNSEFIREMEIWEEIAMQINSHKGKEQKFWEEVMDLHKAKQCNTLSEVAKYFNLQNK